MRDTDDKRPPDRAFGRDRMISRHGPTQHILAIGSLFVVRPHLDAVVSYDAPSAAKPELPHTISCVPVHTALANERSASPDVGSRVQRAVSGSQAANCS